MKTNKKKQMSWKLFGITGAVSSALIGVGYALRRYDLLPDAVSRQAMSPRELSKSDWKQALQETKSALGNKNIPMLAAGVAFFSTLAFFPTLAAFVSIFSLAADPHQVASLISSAEQYLPKEVASLINAQLRASTADKSASLFAAILAIALALWSASSGVQNLIKAVNETYDVEENRGFIKLKLVSICLVLGGVIVGVPLLLLLVLRGDWLTAVGVPEWLAMSFGVLRWIFIALLMIIGLAAFYRYGPDRPGAKWQWVSWGAIAAIVVWLIGTLLFFLYAQNFGNFSKNYGVFAGIIVLMTWLNLSSFIVLIGAQVNRRLEAQTPAITTK